MYPTIKATGDNGLEKTIRGNIATYLNNNVVRNDGYVVTVGNTQKISCGKRMDIVCTQARKASVGSGTKNQTQTSLSQTEEANCSVTWPVYYDEEKRLLFLKRHCTFNFEHSGHLHLEREHMKVGASEIPDDIKEFADKMLGKNCPNSVVQLLLSVMGTDRITTDAMNRMRRAVLITKHKNDAGESTAETLLKMLDNMEGVSYCYMTASYDDALGKVRVRKGIDQYVIRMCVCVFTYIH